MMQSLSTGELDRCMSLASRSSCNTQATTQALQHLLRGSKVYRAQTSMVRHTCWVKACNVHGLRERLCSLQPDALYRQSSAVRGQQI